MNRDVSEKPSRSGGQNKVRGDWHISGQVSDTPYRGEEYKWVIKVVGEVELDFRIT